MPFFGGSRMVQPTPGAFIGPIATFFGWIIDFIFNIIHSLTIYNSLGISIILLTLIVRSAMLPLAAKQMRSMHSMQRLSPEVEKIRKKYADKDSKSQQAMNAEIQKLYQDNKVNPLGGCLPLILQMPLFFGLSFIMNQSFLYVRRLGEIYTDISTLIQSIPGWTNYVVGIAFEKAGNQTLDLSQPHDLNRLFNSFSPEDWSRLQAQIPEVYKNLTQSQIESLLIRAPQELIAPLEAVPDRLLQLEELAGIVSDLYAAHPPEVIGFSLTQLYDSKMAIETFFGMSLTETPGFGFPNILIPILAIVTGIITSRVAMALQIVTTPQQKMQQKIMMWVMPAIMGVFTFSLPIGVGVFWITSSTYQIGQQLFLNKKLRQTQAQTPKDG